VRVKWEHLFEADSRDQELLRVWKDSGLKSDLDAWLVALSRSRTAAASLKANAPSRNKVEDVRDEVEKSAGRALFAFAWADNEERAGNSHGGIDIYDVLPPTPRRALRSGKALIRRIERLNRLSISQLYWAAITMPGRHTRESIPGDFGFGLAATSLGHGVGWDDNHPDPEITYPHWEFLWGQY
jgi:hypothetical protein